MALCDKDLLKNVRALTPGEAIAVTMPNGEKELATHVGWLPCSNLPSAAIVAYIFPGLRMSLLSVGQLCDQGCKATFDKRTVKISFGDRTVFSGTRDSSTGLWSIDPRSIPGRNSAIATRPIHAVAANIIRHESNAERVRWYHAAMGSPTYSTFLAAQELGILPFPLLTSNMIRQNKPKSLASAQGHLDQQRQPPRKDRRKPKQESTLKNDEELNDTFPNVKSAPNFNVLMTIFPAASCTNRAHADLTGRFPHVSMHGNEYILVFYIEDANYIVMTPMRNRTSSEYKNAFRKILLRLRASGFKPHFQRLDNEVSQELLEMLIDEFKVKIELVPPHVHRANKAERAIRTAKNHFVSVLATADPTFPTALWDELLPHAEMTLNLLRTAHIDPTKSAWEIMNGAFSFSQYPLAPGGMKVLVHEKPHLQRGTWDPHGVPGFYLGAAQLHFRTFRIWVPSTQSVREADTVDWFPRDLRLPGSSEIELLTAAIDGLTSVLLHMQPPNGQAHLLPALTEQLMALREIYHPAVTDPSDEDASTKAPPTFAPHILPHSRRGKKKVRLIAPAQSLPAVPAAAIQAARDTNERTNDGNDADVQRVPVQAAEPEASAQRVPIPNPAAVAREAMPVTTAIPEKLPHQRPHRERRPSSLRGAVQPSIRHRVAAAVTSMFVPDKPEDKPTQVSANMHYRHTRDRPDAARWNQALTEEWIRLLETTATLRFIHARDKPLDRLASYLNLVCNPKKYRVRGTYGGNISDYVGAVSADTADMATIKMLWNAVVTEGADFITADITDFYLGTKLERPEYMRVNMSDIPVSIQEKFDVAKFMNGSGDKAWVMVEVFTSMYGLPQAGMLAKQDLTKLLAKHGYAECENTPCLFKHNVRSIMFTLVVDDFGIKIHNKADAEHLFDALREKYRITIDWTGSSYLGITVKHHKAQRRLSISMPGYVAEAARQFKVTAKDKRTMAPLRYTPPKYGAHVQMAKSDCELPLLTPDEKTRIQSIVGKFLYYARAVDYTMLVPLNKISLEPTKAALAMTDHFLQYAMSWPDAEVDFKPSDMQLQTEVDGSYLSETKGRSRRAVVYYLGTYEPDGKSSPNGMIEVTTTKTDVVVSSAGEAETAAMFHGAKDAIPKRRTLEDLGYPQKPTPLISDSIVSINIAGGKWKRKRSQTQDMRYNWLRNRQAQEQFSMQWRPGNVNLADYFTKIHPVKYYTANRSLFVRDRRR